VTIFDSAGYVGKNRYNLWQKSTKCSSERHLTLGVCFSGGVSVRFGDPLSTLFANVL
jgi:hypothetical protein